MLFRSTAAFVATALAGQVLSVLQRQPGVWMSPSQVKDEPGMPGLRTVQRRLTELVDIGTVERGQNGKSYVYRVREAPAWS